MIVRYSKITKSKPLKNNDQNSNSIEWNLQWLQIICHVTELNCGTAKKYLFQKPLPANFLDLFLVIGKQTFAFC